LLFFLEVKIMNIPKIAISHEDDIHQSADDRHRSQVTLHSSPTTPYKSIIKQRSSQPTTPTSTSTTTQTFYTAPTRLDSTNLVENQRKSSLKKKSSDSIKLKKQIIDENDTENDFSELSQIEDPSRMASFISECDPPRRRGTISTTSVIDSKQIVPKRQYSLRQNRSIKMQTNQTNPMIINSPHSSRTCFIPHVSSPPPPLPYAAKNVRDCLTQINQDRRPKRSQSVRQTNSNRSTSSSAAAATLRRFIVRDGKLIEQTMNHSSPIIRRRSTFDNSSYPMTQFESSSIYETPKHDDSDSINQINTKNTVRLVTDVNSETQSILNSQSDMQIDVKQHVEQQKGVCLFCRMKKKKHYLNFKI